MDSKIKRYRAKHHRCRNCKYAVDSMKDYREYWRCNVTGIRRHNYVSEESSFKGMLCKYYEPRENQEV